MEAAKLNVLVRNFTETLPNGNRKRLATIIVRMGGNVIANRVIPGVWDETHAMREFKLFPQRFKPVGQWTQEHLKAIAA